MKNLKAKLKSRSFWVALSGALVMLASTIGDAFGIFVNTEAVRNLVMSVCEVLIILGFVSSKSETTQNKQTNNIDETEKTE